MVHYKSFEFFAKKIPDRSIFFYWTIDYLIPDQNVQPSKYTEERLQTLFSLAPQELWHRNPKGGQGKLEFYQTTTILLLPSMICHRQHLPWARMSWRSSYQRPDQGRWRIVTRWTATWLWCWNCALSLSQW